MNKAKKKEIQVAQGATWTVSMNYFGAMAGMVTFAVAARVLSTSAELGVLAFATLLSLFVLNAGTFAFPQATVKLIASMRNRDEYSLSGSLFRQMIKIGLMLGLVFAFILLAISPLLASSWLGMPRSVGSLQLLAVDIIPVIVKEFLRKSLQGAQKLKEASVAGIAGFAMRNSVAVLLLMFGLGIEGVLIGWIVGDLLESMIGLRYALGVFSGWRHTPFPLREVSAYSGPLYGSNILNYLSATVDRYLVLLLGSASLLGLYSPAISGANLLGMLPVAVSAALFPAFSGIAARNASKIGQAASVTQKWLFVIFMPIAVGFALEASAFVLIVAGPAYIDAAPALVVLALTAGITGHYAVVESVLLGSGKTRILLVSNMIAFLAGLISAIVLIPPMGLVGAALSRAVLRIVQTSVPLGVLAKKGVMQINWMGFIKPMVACLGMAFAVITIQSLASGLMLVFVEVLIGVLVYGLFLRLLRVLTYEDIQIIRELFPKRLKRLVDISEKLLVTKHSQVQQEKANLTSAQPG